MASTASSAAADLSSLFAEKEAGTALNDGLQRAACAVGDYGTPARHTFQRRQPEILLAGQNQGAAAGVRLGHLAVRLLSQKPHSRARLALERGPFGAGPDDVKRRAQAIAGLNGEVNSLITEQARDNQKVVAHLLETGAYISVATGG